MHFAAKKIHSCSEYSDSISVYGDLRSVAIANHFGFKNTDQLYLRHSANAVEIVLEHFDNCYFFKPLMNAGCVESRKEDTNQNAKFDVGPPSYESSLSPTIHVSTTNQSLHTPHKVK